MATEKEMLVTPAIVRPTHKAKSQDEEDATAVQEWQVELEDAVRGWWGTVSDVNKLAYEEAHVMTPLGYCVLDIPLTLGNALMEQYGQNCFQDKSFIRFAQKAFDQTFMPSV